MALVRPFTQLRFGSTVFLALALLSLHLMASTARAQPRIIEQYPADGAVLAAPPETIHLCFSEPVKSQEPQDFRFVVLTPEKLSIGLRVAFETDGDCMNIDLGEAPAPPEGLWTLDWQVTSRAAGDMGSGSLQFTVAAGGSPVPPETPAPTVTPGGPPPNETATPAPAVDEEEDGDGPGILLLAIVATGAFIAATALGLILYRWRLRGGP